MDNDLFWKLLKPVHPQAANFCRKLTGNADDGDDLYQNAVLTAMRKIHHLRDINAFRPWLYRIIVNTFKNRNRSFWWKHRVSLSPHLFARAASIDPESQYTAERLLAQALTVLSPKDRAMVVLHELEGWPIAEIAALFDSPEGTIKSRIFRSKDKLRDYLEHRLPEETVHRLQSEAQYALPGHPKSDS
ncbi:MAG: RNA polymerase sigma factor [Candidatus Zixiibacteriota bacterium]